MIPDFSIAAEVDVEIDGEKDKKAKRELAIEWNTPRILRVPFATTLAASNFCSAYVGDGPAQGRKWDLRRIAGGPQIPVSDAALVTSNGIQVFLFKTTGPVTGIAAQDVNNLLAPDMLWFSLFWNPSANTMSPSFFEKFGDDEATIYHPERLVFALLGMGANSISGFAFGGNVQVKDAPIKPIRLSE